MYIVKKIVLEISIQILFCLHIFAEGVAMKIILEGSKLKFKRLHSSIDIWLCFF